MRTNVRPGQDPGRLTGVNTTNIIYNNKKGPGESEETIIVPQNGVLVGRTVKVTHEYVDPQPEQGEVEVDVELRETKTAASEVTIDTV